MSADAYRPAGPKILGCEGDAGAGLGSVYERRSHTSTRAHTPTGTRTGR